MASNPPGSCCYKGVKHEGTPTGQLSQLGDFEIYTAYPEDKSTEIGILMCVSLCHASLPQAMLTDSLQRHRCDRPPF